MFLGAEGPTLSTPLSLKDSISYALKNNPDIQLAFRELETANMRYNEHKTKHFPRLLAQADFVRGSGPASDALNFNQAKLLIMQPVYTGGKTRGEVNQDEALLRASKSEADEIRNDIVFLVKRAYYAILEARRIADLLRESIHQLESDQTLVERRVDARMAIRLDLLRVKARLSQQTQELLEAQTKQKLAETKFNRLLGRDIQDSVEIEGVGPLLTTTLEPLETYCRRAETQRGIIFKTQEDLNAAKMGIVLASAEKKPQVLAQANFGFSGRQVSVMEKDMSGQVNAVLPLWSAGESRHRLDQARSAMEQANILADEARKRVVDDVTEAFLNVVVAQAKWVETNKALEAGEEEQRVVDVLYREGTATTVDLLDARTNWIQVKIDCVRAQYGLLTYLAQLNQSIGDTDLEFR